MKTMMILTGSLLMAAIGSGARAAETDRRLAIEADACWAAPEPLETRVRSAEKVFVGVIVNRKEHANSWCHADLRVTRAMKGVKVGELVPVIWLPRTAQYEWRPGDDAKEGQTGLAVLRYKHGNRYWLRDDTFENVEHALVAEKMLASDKAAETKTHALPADATATVIVYDYEGGMTQPKNNDPQMIIRADGSVTLGNRYQDNARIETRITKDDLQALLRLAIDTNDFFKINAAEIEQSIDAKLKQMNEKSKAQGGGIWLGPRGLVDGATTVVRFHADGKDHKVQLYDLRGKFLFLQNDERLTRLKNITTRLEEFERKLRAEPAKPREAGAAKGNVPGAISIDIKPHVMRMQPDGTIKCGE